MKKARIFTIPLLCLFFIPAVVAAFDAKTGQSVFIDETETVEGNLYAAGGNITVDGDMEGDLICAGQSINVNGKIKGDVICAGQSINVNGEVGGSVRIAGNAISINGSVAHNIQSAGASIVLGESATSGWDMLVAGANIDIRGRIGGSLHGTGENIVIGGRIGDNTHFEMPEDGNLQVSGGATINGDLTYTSKNQAQIDAGSVIRGEITRNEPKIKEAAKTGKWFGFKLFSIFSALVVGLVIISLWRQKIINLTDRMLEKTAKSIGWGALVMFLTPVVVIILVISVIGIPLSLILLGLWLLSLYLSKIFVGIVIGRSIVEKIWDKKKESLIWAMITGIVLTWLLYSIPLIGGLLSLLAVWWGLGGLWLALNKKIQ